MFFRIFAFLLIFPSLSFSHTELTHEHKSSVVGHNPHHDGINYDYTHEGVSTETKNGVSWFVEHTHKLSNHHINGWKHPGYGDPQYYENPPREPESPNNPPVRHSDCYGDGSAHFHKVDGSGYSHGVDHSGLSLVGGVFTEIHIHPVCNNPKGDNPKGDNPKGDNPKGDDPKGDDPKGDDPYFVPSGDDNDDPSGDDDVPSGDLTFARATSEGQGIREIFVLKLDPLLVTEWMLIDSGRSRPQWIELYNPNTADVNLAGYVLTYAIYEHSSAWKEFPVTLSDFTVPGKSAVILATHKIRSNFYAGIESHQIYQLNLGFRPFKKGWLLQDADGEDVHRTGRAFSIEGKVPLGNPPLVNAGVEWHWRDKRVSFKHYPSVEPEPGKIYYGSWNDVSSPGYYEGAYAAPSLVRPKLTTMWGLLKRRDE